jgi:hypothetical protein
MDPGECFWSVLFGDVLVLMTMNNIGRLQLANLESGVEYIGRADLPFTILIAPIIFWSRYPLERRAGRRIS